MLYQFNVNNYVWVKLTELGKVLYDAHYMNLGMTPPELINNEEGYTRFQMWEVMHFFGQHCFNGSQVPFMTEILLSLED